MNARLLLLALAPLAAALPSPAGAPPSAPRVEVAMRDIGYTLGDHLRMRVRVDLADGQSLDQASLPQAGRLLPWLELRSIAVGGDRRHPELEFDWQLFGTVEAPRRLATPEIRLRLSGSPPLAFSIPSQGFTASPVFAAELEDRAPRPDLPPPPRDEGLPLVAALLAAGAGLLALLGTLWLLDRLPGLPRRPGPMTRLARGLRRRVGPLDTSELRLVHQALDRVAGHSLYPGALDELVTRAPWLAAEREHIERLLRASWCQAFGSGAELPARAEVMAWVGRAARGERLWRA